VDFNTFGSRRGHHEVMMRGTFGNIRIKNRLVDPKEGNWTIYFPKNETVSIYDAAMKYQQDGTPLVVVAGKEYGTGSSRDWAAKGPALQGVKAVIAESYERIHRSNLVGMGVLPLQFPAGTTLDTLGLNGTETFWVGGVAKGLKPGGSVKVTGKKADGKAVTFEARVRLDTAIELEYYRHGGILQYVLRQLAKK
jgi:aconitate hydratase